MNKETNRSSKDDTSEEEFERIRRENKKHPDGTISGTLFYGLLRSEYFESNA